MRRWGYLLKNLAKGSRAATSVEYALICSMIVLAMLAGFRAVGSQTVIMWSNVSSAVIDAH